MGNCSLCDLEKRTPWLWEDDVCRVVECETCRQPMLVFRRHGKASETAKLHAEMVAARLGLGVGRRVGRKIKDHDHWHLHRS